MNNTKSPRILLVRIVNRNLGDAVIGDTTRFLIQKALRSLGRRAVILDYDIASKDRSPIRYADCVVFAGGGILKYRYEHFYHYIAEILQEADRAGVPVMFNAVGMEGWDIENPNCRELQDALRLPCVKVVSCRDDEQLLHQTYLADSSAASMSVFDPAVWTAKAYSDIAYTPQKDVVGLGIARYKLFADNGIPEVDHDVLLRFWQGVIAELEKRDIKWTVFTNGLASDEDFALEVLCSVGHGNMVGRPAEGWELARTIHSFRGIIACRLHSNIIAYSYGIPGVGLVWNEKLAMWGQKIGHPERFLRPEQFIPATAVDTLEQAFREENQGPSKEEYNSGYRVLRGFLKTCGRHKKRASAAFLSASLRPHVIPTAPLPSSVRPHLIAAALGGSDLQFNKINTVDTLKTSLEQGFRMLETDVRLSADGEPVLVNGWNETTYRRLAQPPVPGSQPEGAPTNPGAPANPGAPTYPAMPLGAFCAARYYNTWHTATFEDLAWAMADLPQYFRPGRPRARVLLDVGRPRTADLRTMLKRIGTILAEADIPQTLFLIRLQTEKDVGVFQKSGLDMEIVYHLPNPPKESPAVPAGAARAAQSGAAQYMAAGPGIVLSGTAAGPGTAPSGTTASGSGAAAGGAPAEPVEWSDSESCRKCYNFCHAQNIRRVSVNFGTWTEETAARFKEEDLSAFVFDCAQPGDILKVLEQGAEQVGSLYYGPKELDAWYGLN